MSLRRQYLVAGSLCFVFFLSFYGVTARGKLQASDEAAVFATGVSLATRGHLAIDDFQWLQDRVNIGERGPDGHLYAKYFPGNVFAIALVYRLTARPNDQPYVWVAEMAPSATGARWALRLNALWGALGMTFLLILVRRYFTWRTAVLTVVLVGLCSDWWYQSRGLFSEVGAGAFLIASLFGAFYDRPFWTSTALAVSLLFRPTNLVALPIWIATVWRKGWKTLSSGAVIVLGALILALYNRARFGSLIAFGYGREGFDAPLWRGLYGILLSPGRSIFVYSPVLLLAVPGAWLFYKREKGLPILCLVMVASYIIAVAAWHSWDGGLSWGSRLITPILPVLGLLTAPALEYVWRNKWTGSAAFGLGLIGLTIQVLALLRDPTHVLIDRVASDEVKYEETIYSVRNCWLALQVRALPRWQPCDLDSSTLRHLLTHCPD